MIQVLLRNILSKSEAEREAKQLKGKVKLDDLNSGKFMITKEEVNK